jgi:REP element-mobilizing transposase RayT
MYIEPYTVQECRFAYCYHLYLRWGTHCRRICSPLVGLSSSVAREFAQEFGIELLEWEPGETEVRTLVSLQPTETVAACASKLKGRTSKWLRQELRLEQPEKLLSKGYFACTSGKSERAAVDRYLDQQGEHHGYASRVLPPVQVSRFEDTDADHVCAAHAFTVLRFHLVLGTWGRRGVFAQAEAAAVTEAWRALQQAEKFALLKVSFVPDHVHLAVRVHPAVAPDGLVVRLLNVAQEVIWAHFAGAAIQAGIPRLWQPSAYIGSFGDLATAKIQRYLQNWAEEDLPRTDQP